LYSSLTICLYGYELTLASANGGNPVYKIKQTTEAAKISALYPSYCSLLQISGHWYPFEPKIVLKNY
jgi:hypothetical protein